MSFKIIECPRDAMQGIHRFISTEDKTRYINALLQAGFDTIDFGSFVSPKAIPQMKDTAEVLAGLDLNSTKSKLLAIVANEKGADLACQHAEISYLGFPFSISETFQIRNTNSTIEEAVKRVEYIQNKCEQNNKQLVVYISMGFGNPYGDEWNAAIVGRWVSKMVERGVRILSLSDTVGVATPKSIYYLFSELIPAYREVEFGAHLHTTPQTWREKVQSAYDAGCLRYDGALKGFGGCPMAADTLTGNMPTENLLQFLHEHKEDTGIDADAFSKAMLIAGDIFQGE